MKARYNACCPLCGRMIQKGRSHVVPHPNVRGRWVHRACNPPQPVVEKETRPKRPLQLGLQFKKE
jgi:hypothetical protein